MGRMRRSGRWAGYAGAAWGFLFAAVSLYWAAGGLAGVGTLSRELREQALARQGRFVAILWATVLLKVLAGVLGLALCRPWGRKFPRWMLLVAGWSTGILLTLYGGVGLLSAALVESASGTRRTPGSTAGTCSCGSPSGWWAGSCS